MARKKPIDPPLPEGIAIARTLPPGRHRLLEVFPGLDRAPGFSHYPRPAKRRRVLAERTAVHILPRPGEWMYVAPHEVPPDADARWKPITSETDCIVVGRQHLRKSPAMVLYLDILHELCHLLQREDGRELWDEAYEYVDRPTEVEAYQFVVDEARRLGVGDEFLREYLKVEWVSKKDHLRLLKNVGVPAR